MFCERLLKVIDNPAAHGDFQDEIHKRTAPVSLKPLEKSESRDSVRNERYDFSIKNGVLQFQVLRLLDDGGIFRIEPKAVA